MAEHPDGLVTFEAAGKKYTAVFGMKAMKAAEAHYDKPFFIALQSALPNLKAEDLGDKKKIAEASLSIRFTDVCALFGFGLLKHHPELTEDDIENLIDELELDAATQILMDAIGAALVKEGDAGSSRNPPKARRAE